MSYIINDPESCAIVKFALTRDGVLELLDQARADMSHADGVHMEKGLKTPLSLAYSVTVLPIEYAR